jgi:hypothetical protein
LLVDLNLVVVVSSHPHFFFYPERQVHELHVWQLDEKRAVGSVHIVVSSQARSYYSLLDDAKIAFHRGGVHASTVQVEFVDEASTLQSCYDPLCGDTCESFNCCPPETPPALLPVVLVPPE